jgi:DNA-binding Lrp family transcriptional regulator
MMGANRSAHDERRIRMFVETIPALSETVLSLSSKLNVSQRTCRAVLERLVEEGLVRRRDFRDIEPIYYRPWRDDARTPV